MRLSCGSRVCSKKGVSANQLHRILEVQYKTGWFLAHRIREAMRTGALAPMGGEGKVVEVDETFIGRLEGMPKKGPHKFDGGWQEYKNTVLTLVERGGSARSFHVDGTRVADIVPIVRANVDRETRLMTDKARWYVGVGTEFREAAREVGADVPEAEFDRALKKVASAPPAPMAKPKKKGSEARRRPKAKMSARPAYRTTSGGTTAQNMAPGMAPGRCSATHASEDSGVS